MSTIEEKIQKHEAGLLKAENLCQKYRLLESKWDKKADFHVESIRNLNIKKAQQEKKVE